jgi:putative phosphoesterase
VARSHKRPSARRVAALADVHGNAPALEAVLAEVVAEAPDLVVFCGDLTWGSLPRETLELVRRLSIPARFVRGNGDRAVGTLLDGLGLTCFCHGSPRSDTECVTERTPPERVRELVAGIDERVVVTAHVHVQYDRVIDGVRLLSPGSVGLPYEGRPGGGAYWAMLGPGVELRRTDYDVEAAVARMRATGDPRVETIVELMLRPPPRDEAIAHAEQVVFSE